MAFHRLVQPMLCKTIKSQSVMKKILVSSVLLLSALAAGAQTMYDAMNFSQNNYYGTARTIALSNAVAAIGGDLGTIGINPAGSAVAGYSQFTITPGISYSVSASNYSPVGELDYGSPTTIKNSTFFVPNVGASLNIETGNEYGIKNWTIAFVSNHTNSYHNAFAGFGTNSNTSRFAEFASACNGINCSLFDGSSPYYDTDISWDLISAYKANLFGSYGDGYSYAGNTEMISADNRYTYVAGDLNQASEVKRFGYKSDILFNFGANVNDWFYFGFNFGMPTASYQYDEFYSETAVNADMFPIVFNSDGGEVTTNFRTGTSDYRYIADVSGIYAKAGFIMLPTERLRIGAAIQTPTSYTIKEQWQYSAASTFDNSKFSSSENSPTGSYEYNLRSPYVVDFGIAYTFGAKGFLSVDYELMDYSVMKFSDVYDDYYNDTFRNANEVNNLFCGASHSVRIGAEVRLTPQFALRAGYSFITSPEKYYIDSDGLTVGPDLYLDDFDAYHNKVVLLDSGHFYNDMVKSFSAGLGYSSYGSFFCDLAFRQNRYPRSWFSPYYSYDNYNSAGLMVNVESPKVRTDRVLREFVLTLGWRF